MRRFVLFGFVLVLVATVPAHGRCGKERWHVKTGIDPGAGSVKLASPKQGSIAKLVAIPRQDVDKNLPEDRRFAPVHL